MKKIAVMQLTLHHEYEDLEKKYWELLGRMVFFFKEFRFYKLFNCICLVAAIKSINSCLQDHLTNK